MSHEGTTLLHLQCHFGLDTLSWARLGADVVGLDLSDEAIALARELADEVGLSARAEFVCADLYDADAHLGDASLRRRLRQLGRHRVAARPRALGRASSPAICGPGGTFYMAEIHPFARGLDEVPGEHDVRVAYRLLPAPDTPDVEPVDGSYADREAPTRRPRRLRLGARLRRDPRRLTGAGLRVEHLHEFPTSPAPVLGLDGAGRGRAGGGCPDGKGGRRRDLPLSFSLRADQARDLTRGATMLDDYLKANLASWDEAVGLHVASELYDVEGFKSGRSSLSDIERERARAARPRGHDAAAPAVPLRPRHAELGAARRRGHRRRLLRRGDRAGARPGRRSRPLRARHLRAERRAVACPDVLERPVRRRLHLLGRAHLARRPGALGARSSPTSSSPAARSTSPSSTPTPTPRRRLHAGVACASATPTSSTASRSASTSPATTPTRGARTRHTVTYEWNHGFAEIIDPLLRRGLRLDFLHEFPYTIAACRSPSSRCARTACSASRATTTTSPSASR